MSFIKYFALLAVCGSGCFAADGESVSAPDAGFLYDDFPLTLASGHRTEIAGPAYFHEQNDTQELKEKNQWLGKLLSSLV